MNSLQQTLTLAWRSLLQLRRNPWELMDFSIQPILFLLLFLYVFGGAVAGSTEAYLDFILPGVIVMNLVFVTVYVGHGLNTDLTKGVFDRFRALPIARWAPLAGRILADMVKQAWCVLLLLVVGFLLGFRLGAPAAGVLLMLALLLVFAFAMSWIMVLVGVMARDPEHVQLFGFTALFPVTFLSNVFVPLETLPPFIRAVVAANPVSLLSEAARGLLSGGPVFEPALWSLVWAAIITVVFAPLSLWALNRRLARS
ncbi:ABC transporter [Halovibrio salipaludis]|uniref:Transport permease protein n=1 Tax=Halovibrio salipaludis TaxID=2032626 RepID=A0A2A2F842_9GAMM|nr:ABC transporter permease [Halovibrio salipaludis]PAU81721.1 ABC transporter [Halovibrio salipaludis]